MSISVSPVGASSGGAAGASQQAWVEESAHGGNDATGAVGDPAKPFATMAAAYAAGARHFNLGSGTFAGLSVSGFEISYSGKGKANTFISNLTSTDGSGGSLVDVVMHSAYVFNVTSDGSTGTGQAGGNGGSLTLLNAYIENLSCHGGEGAQSNGVPGGPAGSNSGYAGGSGGNVYLNGLCRVATIDCHGGNGGNVVDDGAGGYGNGGGGGNGGNISGDFLIQNTSINTCGGTGGSSATGNGMDASAGSVTLVQCDSTSMNLSAGGPYAYTGTLTLGKGSIGTLSISGSPGTSIYGTFIYIQSITVGTPYISAVMSNINGTAY